MVAQAAGVDRLGDELRTERMHLDQRRHLRGVAEVVGIHAARKRRRRFGLRGDDPVPRAISERSTEPRKGKPGEVRATTCAADDHVRLLACHGHLFDRFLADDGLVKQDEVEHRPERVLRARMGHGVLDGLADRDPERTRMVRHVVAARSCRTWCPGSDWPRPPTRRSPSAPGDTASGRSSTRTM